MATTEEEILGRTREVEKIVRFLDELSAGHRSLVIAGDAGMGKTTLWRAGVAAAERRAYQVCRCRPGEAETEMAFAALIDLLEEIPEDALEALPGPQRRALEVALLRREPQGPSVDPRAVARAVVGILETLAEAGPVVVAVDDVQWLDPSSARVLQFVFRRIKDAPIGVLASVRVGTPVGVIEPLSEAHSTELLVGPLSLGAIDRLIRTRIDPKVPRPLLVRIHEVSGGNPFFALEIARGLERRGAKPRPGDTLPIPASLGDLVRERLTALGPDARPTLLVAAACSRPTVALVRAAVGDDAQEALDHAISMAVIEPVTDAIEFTHPLLASVLYADASGSERREAHARLALVP
ncbi:MAG: AAA family ATPase [Actinomycetota bacterium]